jgi:hypothetical protein
MNVTRNQTERYVRAKVMRQRTLYQEYFTLKQHVTWEKAEAAAKAWVKEKIAGLPPPMPREGMMTKKNRSGVVGVHRSPGVVKKSNGKVYECPRWIARWPHCPFKGGLSWSVKQFDEDGAFALAVIGLNLKTIDRGRVLDHMESILNTPEFDDICAKRRI